MLHSPEIMLASKQGLNWTNWLWRAENGQITTLLFCWLFYRGHVQLVDCQDSLKPCSTFSHILLDISSFVFVLHICIFLLLYLLLLCSPALSGLRLQLTRSLTPRPKDVVLAHRKMKEVLIEQKIALVGPLSEAGKLGSHGDIPP